MSIIRRGLQWAITTIRQRSLWTGRNVEVKVSEDESEGYVILPGYVFGDLNRAGNIDLWNVAITGEATRWHLIGLDGRPEKLAGLGRLIPKHLVFQVYAHYQMLPDFYDRYHMYEPIKIKYNLTNFGKTSYFFKEEVSSMATGKMLTSGNMMQVLVDKQTRKPAALPDWFIKQFAHCKSKEKPEKFVPPGKPTESFVYPYRVLWSDADYYYHSNHASYVRFCVNATTEAGFKGYFSQLQGDLGKLKVKDMRMFYAAETSPNDDLDIHVSEDKDDPWTVHCHVLKEDKVVHYCSLTFDKDDATGAS